MRNASVQTVSYASGDDGDLQKGKPWPSPRFTDNGNGIKLWTDTLIKVKIGFTGKDCSWFKHGDGEYRKRKVWVTVGGVDSNVKKVKVLAPPECLP